MSKRRSEPDTLRTKAEAQLDHAATKKVPTPSVEELLHELRVHQIELEMQNETLRQSQVILEESRDRYVDFYDFSPVGYLTLNRDALITEINLTGALLLGEERRKLLWHRFAGLVAPEDSNRWHRHFMAALQHDSKQSCELEILRGDGSRLHVQLDSLRLVKEGQAPVVRIVLADITERKQAEAALRKSENRQRLLETQKLAETSLDGFWVVRAKDARIIEVNDAYCKMIGYSREELLNMHIFDLEALETPDETAAHIQKVMATGYDRFETCQHHKQGYLINLEISTSYSALNEGIFFVFVRDISERKLSERIIKKSLDQLKAFIQQAPISIAMFDRQMNYLAVSDRWLAEYGRGNAGLIGRNHYEVHPDMPAEWRIVHQQAQGGATLENKEDMWIQGDGSKHWLRWAVLPWTDQNEKIGGIIISAEDITAQKTMEKEILERRNEMQYLQKLYVADQTAAAIAHELNQPLLAIASYSKAALMLMKAEKPDYDEIYKAIEGSERQAHRAGQSMRELLEFLRMKEFPSEAFDLNQEIHSVLHAAKSEYELQFALIFRQEEELPLVVANRAQVQKVIFNLLCNGIEAMQESGVSLPAITVTVRMMKDENVAKVTIQDNGPGVKKENFHRLFEPFFTTKAKGIGMGLAVSRSLIEANGGMLWVDTREGSGATFHLTLPFAS